MSKRDWAPLRRLRAAGRLTVDDVLQVQGYWRDSWNKTAAEAVAEAFRGACLLESEEQV